MEQQFLLLFQSAKKSADAATASASMMPEVHRCLDALGQLKRFPVISSGVLLSSPVGHGVECLTKHRVKQIRTAASCLLDTWSRKLYARNPAIDGETKMKKSGGVSRTGSLIVKLHGRVLGRIKVGMPINTVKIEEKKIKEKTEEGFSCFRKPPLAPAKQIINPEEKVKGTRSCFKKPSLASAKQIRNPAGKVESVRSDFKKPAQSSSKGVTLEEKVTGFSSFKKPPLATAKQIINPADKVKSTRSCFKKPPLAPAKQIRKPAGKIESIRSGLKKPPQASAKCVTVQEKVTGFTNFKKPSEEPAKFNDFLRAKVRSILVESLSRVVKEAGASLWKAVNSRDPICVAAEVESVMLEKMGPFNGAKAMKYRSILFNLKDPNNPDLRRKVLLGKIKPEKLVTMTSEEMASNQRQFENEQIRMKSLRKEMKNAEQEYKSVDPTEY